MLLSGGSLASGLGLTILGVLLVAATVMKARAVRNRRRQEELAWHADLVARFGQDVASRIVAHEVWLGQDQEQLRASLGEPVDVDEKVMKTKTRQTWKYDQTGVNRFNTRVTLEDGLVSGWDIK